MIQEGLPEFIKELPEGDIKLDGLKSYIFQGKDKQFIFMEFEEDIEIKEHFHSEQWGVVIDGEMELTVGGETILLKKGDTYFIPENRVHSVKIKKGYKDLTLFNQPDRYSIKK